MATPVRHQDISRTLLAQASEEFDKGDLIQASEKAWGAVAHFVKAVARERNWPNRSHQDVRRNATRLVRRSDDPIQNALLFEAVENLHVNFYEDTYAEDPDRVRYGIRHAETLIDAMKAAETRFGRH